MNRCEITGTWEYHSILPSDVSVRDGYYPEDKA